MNDRVRKFFVKRTIFFLIAAAVAIIAWFAWKQYKISQIDSFEECAAAGFPIMESFPEQCRANGQTFVNKSRY